MKSLMSDVIRLFPAQREQGALGVGEAIDLE
jgi:hypothetical protein